MIRLVAGLGNPGAKYRHTPHNIGFEVAEILAERHGGEFRANRKFRADLAEVAIAGRGVTLLMPTTFMNLSGEAVVTYARYKSIPPDEMLVICDDANLPMGKIRFRAGGSHGGQKGLASILSHLGADDFARLRVGIDPGQAISDLTRYVLTPWWGKAREAMEHVCERTADAVERVLETDLDRAMAEFNGQNFLEPPDASSNEK